MQDTRGWRPQEKHGVGRSGPGTARLQPGRCGVQHLPMLGLAYPGQMRRQGAGAESAGVPARYDAAAAPSRRRSSSLTISALPPKPGPSLFADLREPVRRRFGQQPLFLHGESLVATTDAFRGCCSTLISSERKTRSGPCSVVWKRYNGRWFSLWSEAPDPCLLKPGSDIVGWRDPVSAATSYWFRSTSHFLQDQATNPESQQAIDATNRPDLGRHGQR